MIGHEFTRKVRIFVPLEVEEDAKGVAVNVFSSLGAHLRAMGDEEDTPMLLAEITGSDKGKPVRMSKAVLDRLARQGELFPAEGRTDA